MRQQSARKAAQRAADTHCQQFVIRYICTDRSCSKFLFTNSYAVAALLGIEKVPQQPDDHNQQHQHNRKGRATGHVRHTAGAARNIRKIFNDELRYLTDTERRNHEVVALQLQGGCTDQQANSQCHQHSCDNADHKGNAKILGQQCRRIRANRHKACVSHRKKSCKAGQDRHTEHCDHINACECCNTCPITHN